MWKYLAFFIYIFYVLLFIIYFWLWSNNVGCNDALFNYMKFIYLFICVIIIIIVFSRWEKLYKLGLQFIIYCFHEYLRSRALLKIIQMKYNFNIYISCYYFCPELIQSIVCVSYHFLHSIDLRLKLLLFKSFVLGFIIIRVFNIIKLSS